MIKDFKNTKKIVLFFILQGLWIGLVMCFLLSLYVLPYMLFAYIGLAYCNFFAAITGCSFFFSFCMCGEYYKELKKRKRGFFMTSKINKIKDLITKTEKDATFYLLVKQAKIIFNIFESYCEAGFTDRQAIMMIVEQMKSAEGTNEYEESN